MHENYFGCVKKWGSTPSMGPVLGGHFNYRSQKINFIKKSEKNLKNQEKYSKNNGENPSSNRFQIKKLWPKNI